MDVAFFFLIPLQISATIILFYFFPPIFGNAIVTIAIKKKIDSLISAIALPQLGSHNFFFSLFSTMPLPQLLQKKKFPPISAMALPQLVCQFFFFFSLRALHAHGQQNWAQEIRYPCCRNSTFSLSTFFFFSLILLVEFQQW